MYSLIENEPVNLITSPVTTDLSKHVIKDKEMQIETQINKTNFLKLTTTHPSQTTSLLKDATLH